MERPAPEMEEVTLREFTEADAEALFSWASDPRLVLTVGRRQHPEAAEAPPHTLVGDGIEQKDPALVAAGGERAAAALPTPFESPPKSPTPVRTLIRNKSIVV
jgi:RimJ/RimL family protein N-acetyltransferase